MQMKCDVVSNIYRMARAELDHLEEREEVIRINQSYFLSRPYKGRLGCLIYRGLKVQQFDDEHLILESDFLCHQTEMTFDRLYKKLDQRQYSKLEIEHIFDKLLKWTLIKPLDNSWNLFKLSSFKEIQGDIWNMTMVSQFEFKKRFVYQELEVIFDRSLEHLFVDTNEILQEFRISTSPQIYPCVNVLDPGKLLFHKIGQTKRFELDAKRLTAIQNRTFFRLAPLDTWAIFVEQDAIHLGQRMLNIMGEEMIDIDKESVTKAPIIFPVHPNYWSETIKERIFHKTQAIVFIIPTEIKAMLKKQINDLQIPYAIVSQDKLNKMGKRELDQFETKTKKVLRRILIRTGSLPFINSEMPFFEQAPTMLCAIKIKNNRLFMVAILDKHLSRVHTVASHDLNAQHALLECVYYFKQMQRTAPKHTFLFLDKMLPGGQETIDLLEQTAMLESNCWRQPTFMCVLVSTDTDLKFAQVGRSDQGFQTPKRGTCVDFAPEHFVLCLQNKFVEFKVVNSRETSVGTGEGDQEALALQQLSQQHVQSAQHGDQSTPRSSSTVSPSDLRMLCLKLAYADMLDCELTANMPLEWTQQLAKYVELGTNANTGADNDRLVQATGVPPLLAQNHSLYFI